jgi:hypothetical protein
MSVFSDQEKAYALRIIAAHGSAEPVRIKELRVRTGLSQRTIIGIVSDARKAGKPVCSRKGRNPGYWWASSPEEISATAEEMRAQARDTFFTIGRMLGSAAMLALLGQTALELEREVE